MSRFPALSLLSTFHPILPNRARIDLPHPCWCRVSFTISRCTSVPFLVLLSRSTMADPLVCYLVSNSLVASTNQYFPCGNSSISGASAQSCCNAEDYCMDDSICHYTRGGVTNGTGYYMSGCTDPTWKDPACPKQCGRPERL